MAFVTQLVVLGVSDDSVDRTAAIYRKYATATAASVMINVIASRTIMILKTFITTSFLARSFIQMGKDHGPSLFVLHINWSSAY